MNQRRGKESGVALIAVLLVILILTVMMLGFYFETTGEQKVASSDRDNAVAYYGAIGAQEKMSSDVASYFVYHGSPTPAEVSGLTASSYQPVVPGVTYGTACPGSAPACGYNIGCTAPGAPTVMVFPCSSVGATLGGTAGIIGGNGALAGLEGLITPLSLMVIADGPNNTEVKVTRVVQEVSVPVFEFGIFSQGDLSFFAGVNFGFGGRVATNGNLFLAEAAGNTLTLNDKVTAYKNIIMAQLANGNAVANNNDTGTIDVTTGAAGSCPGASCAALTNGSVTGGPGSAAEANWQNLSINTFAGNIRSGTTGAKQLNLALAFAGTTPIAMVQRPPLPPGPADNPTLAAGRLYYGNATSLRILMSDTQANITGLPGIDSTVNPYPLAEAGSTGVGPASGDTTTIQRTNSSSAYYLPPLPTTAATPLTTLTTPLAESPGYLVNTNYLDPANSTLLGGYIKIEYQDSSYNWHDVTQEILGLGISRSVLTMTAQPALASGGSLSASTNYYYVVTALGPWGETLGVEYGPYNSASDKTVTLYWNPMAGASGYRVYRGTSPGGETGYIVPTGVTCGPPPGTVAVQCTYSGVGTGVVSYSDTGAATAPLVVGTPPTNTSILYLEAASPGMAAPTYSESTSAGSLTNGDVYYYVVTALGPWGETTGSPVQTTKTTGSSHNQITVSWTAYPGATGYRVYRTISIDNRTTAASATAGNAVFSGATTPVATGDGYIAPASTNCGTGPTSNPNATTVPCTVNVGATVSYIDTGTVTINAGLPPGAQLNSVQAATYPQNFIPINMYDSREGELRDTNTITSSVALNGVMNTVELNVYELQQWFAGKIGTSGTLVPNNTTTAGYTVYFSDRRSNKSNPALCSPTPPTPTYITSTGTTAPWPYPPTCPPAGNETGEYGYEDTINPGNANGQPNNTLDTGGGGGCGWKGGGVGGEDVDCDSSLETYGGTPHPLYTPGSSSATFTYTNPWTSTTSTVTPAAFIALATPFMRVLPTEAEVNSKLFFRRGLRLVNGQAGNLPPLARANCTATTGGFTVAAENPVYILGDYNANANGTGGFTDTATQCHVSAAVIGDAVTMLSNNWIPGVQNLPLPSIPTPASGPSYYSAGGVQIGSGDNISFLNPITPGNKPATTSWYRFADMSGKNNSFPLPTYSPAPRADFGTDGGTHNFLRMLENWSGQTLNYRGSMASFYTSVQATGVYKYDVVYGAPTRAFNFDTDFQTLSLLPPSTPRFTDVNALTYQQEILASQ